MEGSIKPSSRYESTREHRKQLKYVTCGAMISVPTSISLLHINYAHKVNFRISSAKVSIVSIVLSRSYTPLHLQNNSVTFPELGLFQHHTEINLSIFQHSMCPTFAAECLIY